VPRDLQFKKGDLVEVLKSYNYFSGGHPAGPRLPEELPLLARDLKPGDVYLALSDAKKSNWKQNRRLYIHVMTSAGPRPVWASIFKMRKKE
jgi:hypothetical protein